MFEELLDYARSTCDPSASAEVDHLIGRAVAARNHIAEHGPLVVMKSEDEEGGESGTGGFLDYEEVLAILMYVAWSRRSQKARDAMVDELDGTYTAERLNRGSEQASKILSDVVTDEDALAMRAATVQSARRGAAVANALQAFDDLPRNQVIYDGMARASRYWTNNYFNSHVLPTLQRSVQDLIESNGFTDPTDVYSSLRGQIDQRLLRRVPYWHTVSSSAASRAYHYGMIKGGRRVGYRGYKLVAVRDARTSDICEKLDGKEFWLADAERVYDDIARTENEDIKDVHPWISGEERRALTEEEVYNRAVYVPPFHGRCRTTILLLSV